MESINVSRNLLKEAIEQLELAQTDVYVQATQNVIHELKEAFVQTDVGVSSKPFDDSIKLLRNLADLQNGAPLEQHRQEWEKTMQEVYVFLNRWESQ